jgi:hypothetical protein
MFHFSNTKLSFILMMNIFSLNKISHVNLNFLYMFVFG